nr:Rcs stress response system protein RcsF [Arsenophonus endosymbiont of Bemisia tabaci]
MVKIIDKTEVLLGKPFKDLGIVSGISCQPNRQDPSVNIPVAKKYAEKGLFSWRE